jgi:hypothetical protein
MTKIINEGLQSVLIKQQKKFIIHNLYGRGQSNSPGRLMIDMNSSRFIPVDSKRSTGKLDYLTSTLKDNYTNTSITSGSSKLNSSLKE